MFGWSTNNEIKDFLCKGNDDATREGQETIGALRGVMGLQGKANLDDAPAKQDETDSSNQAKDKGAQVADNSQRIICRKRRKREAASEGHDHHNGTVVTKALFDLSRHGKLICFLVHIESSPFP